jgi:hypothetical protein
LAARHWLRYILSRKYSISNTLQDNFPNIGYDDGFRTVRFVPADRLTPSRFDTLRLKIQEWAGRPIDWSPYNDPLPSLGAGEYWAVWKVSPRCSLENQSNTHTYQCHGAELSLALSQDQFHRYKPTCFPVTTNNVPLLPLTQQGLKVQQAAGSGSSIQQANLGQSSQSSFGTNAITSTISSRPRTTVNTKGIYWCIERNFTEPTEIYLSPIQNPESLDDEQLFRQVNKAIGTTKGWIRRLFSWKRCTAIDFVQVRDALVSRTTLTY